MASPNSHPAGADRPAVRGLSAITTIQAANGPQPAEDRGERHLEAEGADVQGRLPRPLASAGCVWRSRITETWAIVNESIAPNEYIVASRSVSPGIRVIDGDAEKTRIAIYGVRKRGWTGARRSGQLPVLAHRVGEPRDPDQPRVGRDQQDHRGEHPDVVAEHVGEARAEPEVLDDPEHRVVGEGRAERGRELAVRTRSPASPRARSAAAARRARAPRAPSGRPRGGSSAGRPWPPRPCSRSSRSRCRRSSRPRSRGRSRPSSAPPRGRRSRPGCRG